LPRLDLAPFHEALAPLVPRGRSALLPALRAAQRIYGYVPEAAAAEAARALGVPLADVHGVVEFYSMLYREPAGRTVVRVCGDPPCALGGGDAVLSAVCRYLEVEPGGATSADGAFGVERAPCLGLCDRAPAALVGETPLGDLSPDRPAGILRGEGRAAAAVVGGDIRILTANCGLGRATSLAEYEAAGGYAALRKALGRGAEEIIAEVKASGLVGRGGAAFPTGAKWEAAARASGRPKYVVCNGDESEPGTFKDRVLMEEDPHRILEGTIIAAYAVGAARGYVYVRGEYSRAFEAMARAVAEAREAGYLGSDICGSGFGFDVELYRGAGAYVCGEETALFESIEGRRGFPRVKPPFPVTYGLFGRPTVINNVETLGSVPFIVERGAAEFRKIGTEKSPGPKLFCVSGQVQRPGLYEVPFGATIRHLLFELAGGLRPGRSLQTILLGGAAGAFATEKDLDLRMSFEELGAAGLPLGSGAVMVFDDSADLRDVLRRVARFFAHESCGKCYPCQLGTQRQHEIVERVAAGRPLPGDGERLADVGWTMADASLCGLGQTAATAVLSAMKLWPEMFGRR
jgi:NADH-quinone oxidoreductase subunit F